MSLEYFLAEKEGLAVLSFRGAMGEDSLPVLEESLGAVLERKPLGVAIQMGEVGAIDRNAYRGLVLLFRGLKTRGIHFLVTGLAEPLLHNVVQAGLLDTANSRGALPQALLDLSQIVKSAKASAG